MQEVVRLTELEHVMRLHGLEFDKKMLEHGEEVIDGDKFLQSLDHGLELKNDAESENEEYEDRGGDMMQPYSSRIGNMDTIGTLRDTLMSIR